MAELARLIGQTDPFAEYGRNTAQRAPTVPGQPSPAATWPEDANPYPPEQQFAPDSQNAYADQHYTNGGFGRQAYGSAPLSADSAELYPVDAHAPGYAAQGYQADPYANGASAGYDQAFPPSQEPLHDVHQQFGPAPTDDYYDDVAPSRRRISVLAIAGVFALAVLGTAGALGYRAVFGPSSVPATPPVIKADATPSKVVPAATNKEPGKVTDRVGANGQIERLLSREEQPVPVVTTPGQPPANNALATNGAPAMGSGVVGEPRKIRTIPIRPDQNGDIAAAAPAAAAAPEPSAAQPPVRVVNAAPVAEPPRPVAQPAPPPRNVTPQAAAPAQPAPPPAAQPSHAPLSLNPNAQPARPAAPARVAAQTPAPQATAPASGGYAVQVSAQRSEAEAQAAFQSLQGKYPGQLGGRQPTIRRVDLGDKGIYYRAMVVVGSNGEAGELCSSLKAAGGSCIIQRN
ncbi:MAG TPA: SPOR domain-containing protein [Pseudolabrys sp.]|nr:SPOR domain-containing protein [Pseudolabrys sp.]